MPAARSGAVPEEDTCLPAPPSTARHGLARRGSAAAAGPGAARGAARRASARGGERRGAPGGRPRHGGRPAGGPRPPRRCSMAPCNPTQQGSPPAFLRRAPFSSSSWRRLPDGPCGCTQPGAGGGDPPRESRGHPAGGVGEPLQPRPDRASQGERGHGGGRLGRTPRAQPAPRGAAPAPRVGSGAGVRAAARPHHPWRRGAPWRSRRSAAQVPIHHPPPPGASARPQIIVLQSLLYRTQALRGLER